MENLVKQLIDAGLVQARDGAGVAPQGGSSAPAKSPNF
jgi:hypothetical protein